MTTPVIIPAPDALPLPAPALLLQVLLQLTFLLHLKVSTPVEKELKPS